MPMAHVTTAGHVDGHGLCCCLNPGLCPWPALLQGAVTVSTLCAVAEGQTDIHGLYCHSRLRWGQQLGTMWMSEVHTVTRNHM